MNSPSSDLARNPIQYQRAGDSQRRSCPYCGVRGHRTSNCYEISTKISKPTSWCSHIKARVGTEDTEAFPDTGAQINIISTVLAEKLHLRPKPKTGRLIRLPTGGSVLSPGPTVVPFRFEGEKTVIDLDCFILPLSGRDPTLSGPFLHATETLRKYKNRIITAFRQCSR
ncbi:hypothetical protein BDP55DRAFT_341194 [Colletotrichum godetiae]|uniref:Uncharacterized protein n=1 Tax=Colletotrichum godetiae TaxID=1209918 RepID=A0AAJ0AV58_9PEZI|nr:uncharacterized protein BDP55DRAFT_341194 [Colletotrichum godetiae]KAK1690182.1 hypothetical protein BDP55DRAFT_341194 [Colletotrichum godetiae]